MIRAVLFDLYNTLAYVDREKYSEAKQKMAQKANVPAMLFRALWRQYTVSSNCGDILAVEERAARVLRDLGVEPAQALVSEIASIEWDLQERKVRLGSDVMQVLSQLKAMNLKLGIVSNTGIASGRVPELLGISSLLDTVVFSYKIRSVKPGTLIYQVACDNLGVLPEQCLYVGDGDDLEIETAFTLGMHSVLLDEPNSDPDRKRGVQRQHRSISRLVDIIEIARTLIDSTMSAI